MTGQEMDRDRMTNENGFEELIKQYEPLVKSTLRRLGLQNDFDEAKQIGWIALWEAWKTFDPQKGAFPAYAKTMVHGRLKSYARKRYQTNQKIVLCSVLPEEPVAVKETFSTLDIDWAPLTLRERQWMNETYNNHRTTKEIARAYEVSEHTVRSWKKSVIQKLRKGFRKEVFLSEK